MICGLKLWECGVYCKYTGVYYWLLIGLNGVTAIMLANCGDRSWFIVVKHPARSWLLLGDVKAENWKTGPQIFPSSVATRFVAYCKHCYRAWLISWFTMPICCSTMIVIGMFLDSAKEFSQEDGHALSRMAVFEMLCGFPFLFQKGWFRCET